MIIVFAVNPGMSEAFADSLYRDGREKSSVNGAESAIVVDITKDTELTVEAENRTDAGDGQTASENRTGTENNMSSVDGAENVSEDYWSVSESDLKIPDNVSGRNGYQPIEAKEEQLDEERSSEIREELSTGETGDDLSFSEVFYPYYQMLDESGKHLYRQFYANAVALNGTFRPVEEVPVGRIKDVFLAVYNDHPELFWLNTSYACKYNGRGTCIQVDLNFNRTADDIDHASAEFNRRADEIIGQVQNLGSDYEKEREVHNILLKQVEYDLSAEMNQSAYSALINGKTVCAGYARAFQYLMQDLGIPCYYCTGFAGEDHAWDIVNLEDGFYNVDVTWDDTPGGEYEYFNKSDQDYAGTHIRKDLSVRLPACNGQQYRNLEQSSRDAALRSLEDAGFTADDICYTMDAYAADCADRMIQAGKGTYSYGSVLEGEDLFQEWYHMYQTEGYKQLYMEGVMSTIGASSCRMELTAEQLQGDRYLITHYLQVE